MKFGMNEPMIEWKNKSHVCTDVFEIGILLSGIHPIDTLVHMQNNVYSIDCNGKQLNTTQMSRHRGVVK